MKIGRFLFHIYKSELETYKIRTCALGRALALFSIYYKMRADSHERRTYISHYPVRNISVTSDNNYVYR